MAAIRQLQTLRNHPNLQRFLIANARPTGRQLGVGSYGGVEELEVSGVVCAGKKIHETLIEQGNSGAENIASKYVEECQLMSDLRHPHLVQFLGVCFLPNSTLPVLVMECLVISLDDLLEHNPDIRLSLKRSILADVARGLVYLHSRSPPVIHRDLTAKNVLLNSAMVAKISDLGNARIVNFQPGQLARTLSRIPGTMVYMPPEAFEATSMYGPSLDSFSFGHLSLFTLTQVFPSTLLQYTYRDPENPRHRLARTEVQRRGEYIKLLHQQLGEQHALVLLIKQCLDDEPSERPSAQDLLQQLEDMRAQIVDPYQHLSILEAIRMLREKDLDLHTQVEASRTSRQELEALQTQMEELWFETSTQLTSKDAEISRLGEEMKSYQLEYSSQLAAKGAQLTAKDSQLAAKDAENSRLGEDLKSLQADLEGREAHIGEMAAKTERREAEMQRLTAELSDLQSQLQKAHADLETRETCIRKMGAETHQKEAEIYRLMAELRDLQSQLQKAPESPEDLETNEQGIGAEPQQKKAEIDRQLTVSLTQPQKTPVTLSSVPLKKPVVCGGGAMSSGEGNGTGAAGMMDEPPDQPEPAIVCGTAEPSTGRKDNEKAGVGMLQAPVTEVPWLRALRLPVSHAPGFRLQAPRFPGYGFGSSQAPLLQAPGSKFPRPGENKDKADKVQKKEEPKKEAAAPEDTGSNGGDGGGVSPKKTVQKIEELQKKAAAREVSGSGGGSRGGASIKKTTPKKKAAALVDSGSGGGSGNGAGLTKTVSADSVSKSKPTGVVPVFVAGTKVIGKHNFPGSVARDLPFMRGDSLTIISKSKDPNWYKAKRYDNLEGMIPYNYVEEMSTGDASSSTASVTASSATNTEPRQAVTGIRQAVKIQSMPWFHGNLHRKNAEELLSPYRKGQYLVREDENYKGDYALSVSFGDKVEHYRILRNNNSWVTVDEEEWFENLVELVKHYQRDADGLCCQLKHPVENTSGSIEYRVSMQDFKERGWAIPKKRLQKKNFIEKGEFKEVWLGEYQGQKVAIMMTIGCNDENTTRQFLAEAAIMTTLRHPNLVCLIGVSLDELPIYLITEYMAKGSLLDYLRSRGRLEISKLNQLNFAKDICKGMVYLESQNLVHRNLASRNVLLGEDITAKVSDFRLTREELFKTQPREKLLVKWTAPEALRENKYSNKSDVWSFGILLWEIYSYGRVPYPQVSVTDVLPRVERGNRMNAPDSCPDDLYQIMKECWDKEASQRPSFSQIERKLERISVL